MANPTYRVDSRVGSKADWSPVNTPLVDKTDVDIADATYKLCVARYKEVSFRLVKITEEVIHESRGGGK